MRRGWRGGTRLRDSREEEEEGIVLIREGEVEEGGMWRRGMRRVSRGVRGVRDREGREGRAGGGSRVSSRGGIIIGLMRRRGGDLGVRRQLGKEMMR